MARTSMYRTGEFARRARVSVRTLRYYDQAGLLPPSGRTRAGHRLYSDADLATLEQILALKFLGFSLAQIRGYLRGGPEDLRAALDRQRAMLLERREQLDAVVRAIDRLRALPEDGQPALEALTEIMEVVQMERKDDWVSKYFTPEQRRAMEELSRDAYSDAARETLAGRRWTEEDQRRVDVQYRALAEGLQRLVARGADPGDPEAQELAAQQVALLEAFTQGDPEVEAGLAKWWTNWQALPDERKPPALPWGAEEGEFLARAVAIYHERRRGEG